MAVEFDRIKKIFVDQLGIDEKLITKEASIVDDLGADSVDTIELIMALEKEFKIDIDESEIDKLLIVADVIQYIQERI